MKTIRFLFIIGFLLLNSINGRAQFFVGLRDGRQGFMGYSNNQHYTLYCEHSLYSQKPSTQHMRLYCSYEHSFSFLKCGANVYGGVQWDGNYYDYGGHLWGNLISDKMGSLDVDLNPHFDSGYLFRFCYKAGISLNLTDEMNLLVHYSTIPEFRIVEKRIRVGFCFKHDNIQVSPVLSYPIEEEPRTLRVLTSFIYYFDKK